MSVINSENCTLWSDFIKDLDEYDILKKMDFVLKNLGVSGFLNERGSLVLKGTFTTLQLTNLEKLYLASEHTPTTRLSRMEKLDHLRELNRDNKLEKDIESLFDMMHKYFSPEIQNKPVVKDYINNDVLNCLKKAILLKYNGPCEDQPRFYVHMMKSLIKDVL